MQENSLLIPDQEKIEAFWHFSEHLLQVNQITNLTAIRNIPDTICKHLVDSILCEEYIPQGARVLDIGCGPGFPSIPLAITSAGSGNALNIGLMWKAARSLCWMIALLHSAVLCWAV
jgi:16S rRNA G527 N7-methylase RsmG